MASDELVDRDGHTDGREVRTEESEPRQGRGRDYGALIDLLRRVLADRTARVALFIIALFAAMAILAPVIAPHDPTLIVDAPLQDPTWEHLLGTDGLGRDMLSRVMFGARLTLGMAATAALIVLVIGAVVGLCSGYFGGFVDTLLMRLVDMVLAFPGLLAALAIAGMLRPSLTAVLVGLVSVWWAGYARIVRGMVLSIRERPFVEAAHVLGAHHGRILLRHILPHVLPPTIVLITIDLGSLILAFAGLSFLGLGAQPPAPEWGAMLNEARTYFFSAPRVMLIPGAGIATAVFAFNLLGDGLRDAVDPRTFYA